MGSKDNISAACCFGYTTKYVTNSKPRNREHREIEDKTTTITEMQKTADCKAQCFVKTGAGVIKNESNFATATKTFSISLFLYIENGKGFNFTVPITDKLVTIKAIGATDPLFVGLLWRF